MRAFVSLWTRRHLTTDKVIPLSSKTNDTKPKDENVKRNYQTRCRWLAKSVPHRHPFATSVSVHGNPRRCPQGHIGGSYAATCTLGSQPSCQRIQGLRGQSSSPPRKVGSPVLLCLEHSMVHATHYSSAATFPLSTRVAREENSLSIMCGDEQEPGTSDAHHRLTQPVRTK